MISLVLITFFDLFVTVFNVLLLVRVIMSWIYPSPDASNIYRFFYSITEPVLAPVRKLLPGSNMLDLAPLVVFFGLQILQQLITRLI